MSKSEVTAIFDERIAAIEAVVLAKYRELAAARVKASECPYLVISQMWITSSVEELEQLDKELALMIELKTKAMKELHNEQD